MRLSNITAKKVFIYAPNLSGGGIIFLKYFLESKKFDICGSVLPIYTKDIFPYLKSEKNFFLKKGYFARFISELNLRNQVPNDSLILCAHGLPPLFKSNHDCIILFQNKILFYPSLISMFRLRRRFFLKLERFVLLNYSSKKYTYLAFTLSMFEIAQRVLQRPNILLEKINFKIRHPKITAKKKYNFIYPASGEPHKNHINLIKSFVLLANHNIYPTLLLILNAKEYPDLFNHIHNIIKKFNLKITMISNVKHSEMPSLYLISSALIYPSFVESLGLPLMEAKQFSLDIISSNEEYIFDILQPKEVFDPENPVSIASAIINYLKVKL